MDLDVPDLLVGILGGFLLSAAWWFVSVHWVVPTVTFGKDLMSMVDVEEGPVLAIRVTNTSRFRSIIDLEMHVLLCFDTTDVAEAVKLDPDKEPYYSQSLTVQRVLEVGPGRTSVMTFGVDAEKFPLVRPFVDDTKPQTLTWIVGYLLAYDSLSGSRKLFISQRYRPDEVTAA